MIVNERIAAYINSLEGELPEYLLSLEEQALKDFVPIIRKDAQSLLRFSCSLMAEYMPSDCTITTIERFPKRVEEAKKNLSLAKRSQDMLLLIGDAMDVLRALNGKEEGYISEIYSPHNNKSYFDINDVNSEQLSELKKSLREPYDFIFMDAAKGQYMNFLPEIMELLPVDGLLITDNVLQEGSIAESKYSIIRRDRTIHVRMREYLYALTHMEEFDTVVLPVGDGMTLSTRIK